MKQAGIISYGSYIPRYRIKVEEICSVWGKNPNDVITSLGINEKAVAGVDEDSVTLAVEAAQLAIARLNPLRSERLSLKQVGSIDIVFVGSESHPYAVNPTSTIVGDTLGLSNNYLAADLEFACKAATAGMQASLGLIESGRYHQALVIGSDKAQSRPHDALEYTAGSAAVAYILGSEKVIAKLICMTSYSSDTPDFWRRDGIKYPSHGGRFTGKPAYLRHVKEAATQLLKISKTEPTDYKYCVFHMPNGKFPRQVAKELGFSSSQLEPSLIINQIGNPYSASTLIGFAAVLDVAKPGERIFVVSYGSGAGSDAFSFEVTKEIVEYRKLLFHSLPKNNSVATQIKDKEYINYIQYLKMTGII